MRLEFLLVVVLTCLLSQGSPVSGRHLKKKYQSSANKEVRSIISAIVDAILDGDRKRRSEVVDYSEDEDGRPSKTLASEEKSKYENENAIEKNDVGERTLTFTKREDRDSDQGLRLANVIATSDVNATDDESGTLKRNTIEQNSNVTNTEFQDKDPEIDDDSEHEDEVGSGTADDEKLSPSGLGFSENKSEVAWVQLESGRSTGLSDGAKKDAQPAEIKSGSPYSESGNGSGDNSDDDDNDDNDGNNAVAADDNPEIESESSGMTPSGSDRDASDDMDAESGSGDDDSENAISGDAMEEKAIDNNKNVGEENYRNNISETVSNVADDKKTSQKMDKDYVSEKSGGQGGEKNETVKLDKNQANWNKEYGDTDTIVSMIPPNSSKKGGGQFVSEEKLINQSEQNEKSTLASNQVSENFPGDIDKQVNNYNNISVEDHGQGGATKITRNYGLGNSRESNNMQFGLNEKPEVFVEKDVEKGNPLMRRDQALVGSMDGNNGESESNKKVLKQNKHNSNENGSLVTPNLQENSQLQRKSDDKNLGTIENRNVNTTTIFDEISRNSTNNGDKQFVSDSGALENSMDLENINFEKEERGIKKQFENLAGNSVKSEKQNSEIDGRESESQNFENSVSPENINIEKNQVGFEKEPGNLRSNILTGDRNLVHDQMKFEKRFGNLGNNIGVENTNFGKDQRDFQKQSDKDSGGLEKFNPHTGSYTFEQVEPGTGTEENLGNIPEDNRGNVDYHEQMANNRAYENSYYNIENQNPYRYQNNRALLDKRNSIPQIDGFPNRLQPIKNNALDGLVSDVGEPWVKDFLTKTLEMAVNGENVIKTPTQDAAKNSQNIPTKSLRRDSEEKNLETASKEMIKSQKDNMPADATKSSDKDDVSTQEEDYDDDDSKGNDDKDDDESGDVRARTIEEGKLSPLQTLNKMNIKEKEGSSHNNIKGTSPPEQTEGMLSEIPKDAHQSAIPATPRVVTRIVAVPPVAVSTPIAVPASRVSLVIPTKGDASVPIAKIVPAQAEAPRLPVTPPNKPLVAVLQVARAPGVKNTAQPGNIIPGKVASSPSSGKTGPLVPDEDSKEVNTKQEGIVNEFNNIIDNEIQNIDAFSKEKLESDSKEARLSQMLKDAIPMASRRPNDIDNDIKQEIDDLKDYASALTETAGLAPAHHDDLARKLASDLLDEMKVSDERKEELLKQLMAFFTSVEFAAVRERLTEIRAQVLSFATTQSEDPANIRAEAVRLLDEFLDILPLPKVEIEAKKKRLLESKLLKSLVSEAERRSLRVKLKKTLVHLVADKLL